MCILPCYLAVQLSHKELINKHVFMHVRTILVILRDIQVIRVVGCKCAHSINVFALSHSDLVPQYNHVLTIQLHPAHLVRLLRFHLIDLTWAGRLSAHPCHLLCRCCSWNHAHVVTIMQAWTFWMSYCLVLSARSEPQARVCQVMLASPSLEHAQLSSKQQQRQ